MFLLSLIMACKLPMLDSTLEELQTGFQFIEGPVWHPEGYLLFSDIPADRIYCWTPSGELTTFREPSGNSNGLTYDRQRHLVACEHGNRRVSRTEADGSVVALATHYQGKRLNSPNDAVVKSDGSVYFTDPPYGVQDEDRELGFQGVYRIAPDGTIALLVDDFEKPNGLAFSTDERTLYIADTPRRHVRAFDVMEDGTIANGRVFCEQISELPGGPDGMKVDMHDNLYVTAAGGVWVFNKDGEHLGTIEMPHRPANCAFGDADNQTLYITAQSVLYRIRLGVAGVKVTE